MTAPRPLRPVGTNTHLLVRVSDGRNLTDGHTTDLVTVLRHQLRRAVPAVRLVYANWFNSSGDEADPPNAIAVRAAIGPRAAAVRPVTFHGRPLVRLAPGESRLSDPVELDSTASGELVSRTQVGVGPGGLIPLGPQTDGTDGVEGCTANGGRFDAAVAGTRHGYGPWAILAEDTDDAGAPVGLVTGDSNAVGFGDARGSACHHGWVARVLDRQVDYLNVAISGATARSASTAEGMRRRLELSHWIRPTFVIAALGTNDLQNGGPGVADIRRWLTAHWRLIAVQGAAVIACTLPPVSRSNDSWSTAEGQIPDAGHAVRAQVNSWLRTVPAPLSGLIDLAAVAETESRDGRWRPGHTNDGVHLNEPGHVAVADAVTADGILAVVESSGQDRLH